MSLLRWKSIIVVCAVALLANAASALALEAEITFVKIEAYKDGEGGVANELDDIKAVLKPLNYKQFKQQGERDAKTVAAGKTTSITANGYTIQVTFTSRADDGSLTIQVQVFKSDNLKKALVNSTMQVKPGKIPVFNIGAVGDYDFHIALQLKEKK